MSESEARPTRCGANATGAPFSASERRHHLGGVLGAALLAMFLEQGWLVRTANDRRLLSITEVGRKQFDAKFSIQ